MRIFTAAAPPFWKNGYLLAADASDAGMLIDPGDEVEELLAVAARERIAVQAILLTHAHLDHITGVGRAKAALGVETWLHAADQRLYEVVEQQGLMFGLQVQTQPPVDHFYAEGQVFEVGGLRIAVHPTPGHSPGGVCLEVRDPDGHTELIVGDTLFAGSVGRTDLPGADHATLIRSIREVLLAFPDETPVHSGHGPDTTIGQERRTNPFLISPVPPPTPPARP
jgi:glyoxylase-like metal-dependent hydrolase (beta-lactamase superfamily II)